MSRSLTFVGLAVTLGLALLWATGALGPVQVALQHFQHEVQNRLADAVRALRGNQPGALGALIALCLGYGVVHAAGPGHGKMLIGGYAVARRVRPGSVIAIALGASLAQAGVAIALVYGGLALLDWTRESVLGLSDAFLTPLSYGLVGLLGGWLVLRSLRRLRAAQVERAGQPTRPADAPPDLKMPVRHTHANDPGPPASDHGHHAHCDHAHGPTLAQIAEVATWRDAGLLIAGIAMRPCTGALFLLILTWRLGIGFAGVMGVVAMGLGTAVVTMVVGGLAVWAREGLLAGVRTDRILAALPVFELVVGSLIVLVCAMQLTALL
jgi:nickel/cobalt transporter (NicO) family protein